MDSLASYSSDSDFSEDEELTLPDIAAPAVAAAEEEEEKVKEKKKKKKEKKKEKRKRDPKSAAPEEARKKKKKLPSAAALLSAMPSKHLGRKENVQSGFDRAEEVADRVGDFSAVPPPSALNIAGTVVREAPSLALPRKPSTPGGGGRRSVLDIGRSPQSSPSGHFAPPQIARRVANISTEDQGAWNSERSSRARKPSKR